VVFYHLFLCLNFLTISFSLNQWLSQLSDFLIIFLSFWSITLYSISSSQFFSSHIFVPLLSFFSCIVRLAVNIVWYAVHQEWLISDSDNEFKESLWVKGKAYYSKYVLCWKRYDFHSRLHLEVVRCLCDQFLISKKYITNSNTMLEI